MGAERISNSAYTAKMPSGAWMGWRVVKAVDLRDWIAGARSCDAVFVNIEV